MANRTAWTAGNGAAGLTWSLLFAGADLNSLGSASAVMSSNGAITNGTALDQFMDVSFLCTIASTTLTSGANFALYLYGLLQDGATYGNNAFSAGNGSGHTITNTVVGISPVVTFPFPITGSAATIISGFAQGIVLPPGSFLPVLANFTAPATALAASGNACYYRTYNQNLNN